MMCVLVNVYRASSATSEKVKSYQLPLFSIQGIYKSDYSQLSRKRLILRSIGGPEPALRHSGERDKGKTHHAEAGGASWGIVGRLRGLFMGHPLHVYTAIVAGQVVRRVRRLSCLASRGGSGRR